MEHRMFGLRRDGLICFGKGLKTVCWNQQYSDISDWAISNSSFHLVSEATILLLFYAFY